MTDNINEIKKLISDINDKGYFDKYGGSFLLVFVVVTSIGLMIYYSYFMENLGYIKKNWDVQRCVPMNMPFVAEVFPPTDGKTKSSFIFENFNYCVDTILKGVVDSAVSPLQVAMNSVVGIVTTAQSSLNQLWQGLNAIRSRISALGMSITIKIYGMLTEFRRLMYKLQDTFSKIAGVFAAVFQSIMSVYYTKQSFIGAFYEIIQMVTVYFISLAIMFYYIPFFVGVPMGIFFSTVSTLLVLLLTQLTVAATPILDMSQYWVPRIPGFCFSKDTTLKLYDGSYVRISDIRPSAVLHDGSIVTSCFKMKNYTENMYKINNNIVVTPEHVIYIDDKPLSVKKSGVGKKVEYTDEFLYCINTTNKRINIDGYIFGDYDEVSSSENETLCKRTGITKSSHYWKMFEGGFHPDTHIELKSGEIKQMKEIKVGDRLVGDIEVLGVVNGCSRKLVKHASVRDSKNENIVCSDNVQLKMFFGKTSSIPLNEMFVSNRILNDTHERTINLLTSTSYIPIGFNMFWDFDGLMKHYLDTE